MHDIFGISQNSDTNDYIMVLYYVEGGSFNIIKGLGKIHGKTMVHRDLHIGNILFVHLYIFQTWNYVDKLVM